MTSRLDSVQKGAAGLSFRKDVTVKLRVRRRRL